MFFKRVYLSNRCYSCTKSRSIRNKNTPRSITSCLCLILRVKYNRKEKGRREKGAKKKEQILVEGIHV